MMIYESEQKLLKLNEKIANFCAGSLNAAVNDYLKNICKLTEATIHKFKIGYFPKRYEEWFTRLEQEEGLGKSDTWKIDFAEEMTRFCDSHKGRIMFPVFNLNQNIQGFFGKLLYKEQDGAVWKFPDDTIVHYWYSGLYGQNFIYGSVTPYVLLVGTVFDVILSQQAGFPAVTITSSKFTHNHAIKLNSLFGKRVIVCIGSLEEEQKVLDGAVDILRRRGLEVGVVSLPENISTQKLILEKGADEFQKLIDNAVF